MANETEHKGRIYWKRMATGVTGHESAILPFSVAKALIDEGNRNFPEIRHWFVPIGAI